MLKIMIVDHNVLFREGLINLLRAEPGISVVGEAGLLCEAAEKIDHLQPDLILVDADLPDIDEYQGIRMLRMQRPQMQVVILSAHDSPDLLMYAVRNGARGYLPKNNSLIKFMAAIRALERGEAVIPRAMVGLLMEAFARLAMPKEQDFLGLLTSREQEVLAELGRGRSNRQIAEKLDIAENTVKVHVHNILEKLSLRNRRQAAQLARGQGGESRNKTQAAA